MIYLIDFEGQPRGMYRRTPYGEVFTVPPMENQILITNPDLEAFSTIPNKNAQADYFTVIIEDVNAGRTSPEAMRFEKHLILVYGWELSALLKRIHPNCFELSFGGGERMWVRSFGMGEPVE